MKREFLTKQETITEGLGEDAARAEQDHEVQMARADCFYAAKDAIELHRILSGISEAEGIDGWVASKITLAADYLRSVKDHLAYKTMTNQVADEVVAEREPEIAFIEEEASAGASTSGGMATAMNGNGFADGGPGTLKRFKKKMSEAIPTGTVGTSGTDDGGEDEVADALKKSGNTVLANKLKTGVNFNKDELKAIIAAKG